MNPTISQIYSINPPYEFLLIAYYYKAQAVSMLFACHCDTTRNCHVNFTFTPTFMPDCAACLPAAVPLPQRSINKQHAITLPRLGTRWHIHFICFLINGQNDFTYIFAAIQNVMSLFRLRDRQNLINGGFYQALFHFRPHAFNQFRQNLSLNLRRAGSKR